MADRPRLEEEERFDVKSIYGLRTKLPLVDIQLGEKHTQVSPAKAREMAMMLLEAAETAMQDGFLVEFAMLSLNANETAAGALLIQFRHWREQKAAEIGEEME